jgi:hypothetical protein
MPTVTQGVNIAFSTTGTDTSSSNIDKIKKALTDLTPGQNAIIKTTQKMNAETGKVEKVTVSATTGLKKFKFEALGVMFAGMAISRTMSNLFQPAMEAAGVFDIINTTLELLLLPATMALIDPLLGLMDSFDSLTETEKEAVGFSLLAAWGFGEILNVIGQTSLAVSSLKMMFGNLDKVLEKGIDIVFKKFGFDITSSELGSKIGGFLGSGIGKAGLFVAGTGLIVHSYLAFQGAQGDIKGQILALAEGTLGAAFIGGSLGLRGGGLALFSVGAALLLGALYGGNLTTDILSLAQAALGAAFLGFMVAGPYGALFGISAIVLLRMVLDPGIQDAVRELYNRTQKTWIEQGPIQAVIEFVTLPSKGAKMPSPPKYLEFNPFYALFGLGPSLRVNLPWGQEGGIVTRPTVMGLGEAGPEAVIPLNEAVGFGSINATYYVNANVGSDVDIRELAYKLNDYLVSDYRRLRA